MQGFGSISGRERGSALVLASACSEDNPLGNMTPNPAQYYTNAGNSLQSPLGDDVSPRPFSQFNR